MRIIYHAVTFTAFTFAACSALGDNHPLQVTIIKRGLFKPYEPVLVEQNDSLHGYRSEFEHAVMVTEGRVVSLIKDHAVGFEFMIDGLVPNKCRKMEWSVSHPTFNLPNGKQSSVEVIEFEDKLCGDQNGQYLDTLTWQFSERWEMVEGQWVFRIAIDGTVYVEEKFTVKK